MNERLNQRAKRVLLAALLRSDFSLRELGDLCRELERGGFMFEFSTLLSDTIRGMAGIKSQSDFLETTQEDEASVYKNIQRRRLSKQSVIQMMKRISGRGFDFDVNGDKPMREIIRTFFKMASPDDVHQLTKIISSQEGTDLYLREIVRRG